MVNIAPIASIQKCYGESRMDVCFHVKGARLASTRVSKDQDA